MEGVLEMPLAEATPSELMDIASLIRSGRIRTLEIRRRKSGKNKGSLMADYAIARPPKKEPRNARNYVDRLIAMSRPAPPPSPEEQKILHYRQRIASILESAAKSMLAGDTVNFEIAKQNDPEVERYTYILEVK